MKLILLIGFVALTSAISEVDDFGEELLLSGEVVYDSEDAEEEAEADLGNEDSTEPDISGLAEEFDYRFHGTVHPAIHQGTTCGSCAYVAGTHVLEGRIGHVSENYLAYSIQAFMNCRDKICKGGLPYSITSYAKKTGFINLESEIPYTKRYCIYQKPNKTACTEQCGAFHPRDWTNALDDQFVIIAGTRAARSEPAMIAALQGGPLSTCFNPKRVEPGERCSRGCQHINTVVGYTRDKWIIQESYGKHWGGNKDGSWRTTRGSQCGNAIMNKAYYPYIIYDYDRANAYYTELPDGVDETKVKFLEVGDYGLILNNTRNWGTAKNKCAFLGSACLGVVERSNGQYELVSSWGANTGGDQRAFKKTQMVVYLKHDETGEYVKIQKRRRGKFSLTTVQDQANAAPFFVSYSRLISYEYPLYHLVDNKMEKIVGGIKDIDVMKAWTLDDCNIYNPQSGNSFDVITEDLPRNKKQYTLGASPYDPLAPSQRFGVGLSGRWTLRSSLTQTFLAELKGKKVFTDNEKASVQKMRWNARQILRHAGYVVPPTVVGTGPDFKFGEKEFEFERRHCVITRLIKMGMEDNLALVDGNLVMSSDKNSHWSLEQGDL